MWAWHMASAHCCSLGFFISMRLTASAVGPIGSILSIDGLPSAQGAVSAATVLAAENGQPYLAVAFVIWTVIALASTVDSFYCATSWFLKGKNLRSNSPLLALIPDGIASSPLWLLFGAAWVAFTAVPANFSLMYFMMPFATLFVSASANLVCEALGAKPKFDPVLSFHDRLRFVADIRNRLYPASAGLPVHLAVHRPDWRFAGHH